MPGTAHLVHIILPLSTATSQNLSLATFLHFWVTCLFTQSAEFQFNVKIAKKQIVVFFIEWTISPHCDKLIWSTLREQWTENLSGFNMKLIYFLFKPSEHFCQIVWFSLCCDGTEGALADVHSLPLLFSVYTFTLPDVGDCFSEADGVYVSLLLIY